MCCCGFVDSFNELDIQTPPLPRARVKYGQSQGLYNEVIPGDDLAGSGWFTFAGTG